MRAGLRPSIFVLDDKSLYIKGNEYTYQKKNGKNMLKLDYYKSSTVFEEGKI